MKSSPLKQVFFIFSEESDTKEDGCEDTKSVKSNDENKK